MDARLVVQPATGSHCLFEDDWWLDAVAPGRWQALTIEKNGAIVARWPVVLKGNALFRRISMPQLTPALGPWISNPGGKASTVLSHQKDLINALIARLPKHDSLNIALHANVTNWLPFYWHDFSQTTAYSYVLDDLSNLETIWRGFSDKTRNGIRKAEKLVSIEDISLERFIEVNRMTYRRQGKEVPYSTDLLRRIDAACAQRHCRQIIGAVDGQGRLHAGGYFVWDHRSGYYLMGGSDPELHASNAMSLVIWAAIKAMAPRTKIFDFEGSMMEPVERFIRSFGATQRPYFRLSHYSRKGSIAAGLHRLAARGRLL